MRAYINIDILETCLRVPSEFSVEYVVLPNGRIPAHEFLDSVDDTAAAKVLAFIEQLRIHGNQMRAERLRNLWLKYRNRYPESEKARESILREAGL